MQFEQIIGLVGVVTGTLLGYVASYLNNYQRQKSKLDSEYREWQRLQLKSDFEQLAPVIKKFSELAHLYIEYGENIDNYHLKERLNEKKKMVLHFLKEELTSFPISLKDGSTKSILHDLDDVTDHIERLALYSKQKEILTSEMSKHLEGLRHIEKELHIAYIAMIEKTFK